MVDANRIDNSDDTVNSIPSEWAAVAAMADKFGDSGTGNETAMEETYDEDGTQKIENEPQGLNADNNVYREIARDALMNWNGLSEEEANEKVANSSVDELEGQVYAGGSIKSAVEGIRKGLADLHFDDGVDVSPQIDAEAITEGIFNQSKDSEALSSLGAELAKIPGEKREEFTLGILENIHNQWAVDNQKKFFDENRANKRYQFMPLEMIGYKEASADLLFVKPILESAGFEVSDEKLEEEYNKRSKRFLDENIGTVYNYEPDKSLATYISDHYWPTKRTEVGNALQDEAVANSVLEQVSEHNPVIKERLEDWGYGTSENITRQEGVLERSGDVESALQTLNEEAERRGHSVVMAFGGNRPLRSGMTLDDWNMQEHGMTTEQLREDSARRAEKEAKDKEEYLNVTIPEILKESEAYIPEEKMDRWKSLLENNVSSYGREVTGDIFSVVKTLNDPNLTFADAKKQISKEHNFVMETVAMFSERGPDFYLAETGVPSEENMRKLIGYMRENEEIKARRNREKANQ